VEKPSSERAKAYTSATANRRETESFMLK